MPKVSPLLGFYLRHLYGIQRTAHEHGRVCLDKLGRVRVRCVGYHTDDVNKIPTADLPWAWVMMPTTTSSMGGLGEGMPFIVEGSWVVGFWRDPGHARNLQPNYLQQ